MNLDAPIHDDPEGPDGEPMTALIRLEALRLISIRKGRLERLMAATKKQWGDAIKESKQELDALLEDDPPADAPGARTRLDDAIEAHQEIKRKIEVKEKEVELLKVQITAADATFVHVLHAEPTNANEAQVGLDIEDDGAPMGWLATEDLTQLQKSLDDATDQGMRPTDAMRALRARLVELAGERLQ